MCQPQYPYNGVPLLSMMEEPGHGSMEWATEVATRAVLLDPRPSIFHLVGRDLLAVMLQRGLAATDSHVHVWETFMAAARVAGADSLETRDALRLGLGRAPGVARE